MSATVHTVASSRENTTQPQHSGAGAPAEDNFPKEAIEAHERGWSMVGMRGKKPVDIWLDRQELRPSIDTLEKSHRNKKPDGYAVICGPTSGVFVIEAERPKDGRPGGAATLEGLGLRPHVKTKRGSLHCFVTHPGFKIKTAAEIDPEHWPSLEAKGDNSLATFCGIDREIIGDISKPIPFASLPPELQAALKAPEIKPAAVMPAHIDPADRVPAREILDKALSRGGPRNEGGLWLARQLLDNGYSESEAAGVMRQYVASVPQDGERYSEKEAIATLQSALRHPRREPWKRRRNSCQATPQVASEDASPPDLLRGSFTNHGFAVRFVEHGDGCKFLYVHERRQWYVFTGKRWEPDHGGQVLHAVVDVIKGTGEQVQAKIDSMNSGSDPADLKLWKDCAKKCKGSETARSIQDILGFVKGLGRTVSASDFDKDPYLLNCANGTINLKTGELLQHNADDLIAKIVQIGYKKHARCPRFRHGLIRAMHKDSGSYRATIDRVRFLQRAAGLAISGDVSDKCIFIMVGDGDTGKTTLLKALRLILGDYAGVVNVESLLAGRSDSNTQDDLGDLIGKRFVTSSEADASQRLSHRLKYLSQGAGAPIKTIKKFQSGVEFVPTHKLFIDTNSLPMVDVEDGALWNRLKPIKFYNSIPKSQQDGQFPEKLAAEAEGILAWAVDGFRMWDRGGLGSPPDMDSILGEWQERSNPLAQFVEDRLVAEEELGNCITLAGLKSEYLTWCGQMRLKGHPLGRNKMNAALRRLGIEQEWAGEEGSRGRVWKGVRSAAADESVKEQARKPATVDDEAVNDIPF